VAKRFLVIGELNVDVMVLGLPRLPEMGAEILCERVETVMGSSSAIFACRMATLGEDVSFLGVVGDDSYGRIVLSGLRDAGVDTSHVIVDPAIQTGMTCVLRFPEDRAMFTLLGSIAALTADHVELPLLAEYDHLHLTCLYLQHGLLPGLPGLLDSARAAGLTVSLDPQWDPAEKWVGFRELAARADVLLPNADEALGITGAAGVGPAARHLAGWGRGLAVVKRGAEGALAVHSRGTTEQPAFAVEVVDTTGAGDTFDAAFVKRLIGDGASLPESLRYACAAGALACTQIGGARVPLRDDDVRAMMEGSCS